MIDYSQYPKMPAVPEASSMIETFRAIGYSIETAIADIIDNSISASAKNIWIDFEWNGENTWIAIKDDGVGMQNDELIQALKPGSRNPLEDRSSKDLGRFGLGLKTASFSQCRQLTAISKPEEGDASYWTWDLDFVGSSGNWNLLQYITNDRFLDEIKTQKSGTLILWNNIDRLVKNFSKSDSKNFDKFLDVMLNVKKHIAMVFHKFIETGRIKIHFQGREIEPWNPFLTSHSFTQGFPDENLYNGKVRMKGYVLPHKSKLSGEEFRKAEGVKGWNAQQGFYVYRNDRLLLAGDWLGLFRKEEHYKLARIEINLPNDLDSEWQIDIKKSVARPPLILRERLKAYASAVRNAAVEVYRHKGKSVKQFPGQKFVPLWVETKRGDKWFYKVNREHPVFGEAFALEKQKSGKGIEMLVRFIEETIPARSVYIRESEQPEGEGKPFEDTKHDEVLDLMKNIFDTLISSGKTFEEAKAVIINIDPFHHYPEYIANL